MNPRKQQSIQTVSLDVSENVPYSKQLMPGYHPTNVEIQITKGKNNSQLIKINSQLINYLSLCKKLKCLPKHN